ncbi:MAG: ubiquinone/menaquinone biosynthesis C-methylase UbiE [Alphaproteobacteria bacterium]|jgi:ubiquinone/menaquinone biosynthesis C-methylase UbiE
MNNSDSPLSLDSTSTLNAGWKEQPLSYNKHHGKFSMQAIRPLLDAVKITADKRGEGQRLLDVACGPGFGAGEAALRGATATGLDITPGMVEIAKRNFPGMTFIEGDGQALPFPDKSFDAVVSCFGMPQMESPERAIAEAYRVLELGGIFGFALRAGIRQDFFKQMVQTAVLAHGKIDEALATRVDIGLRDPDKYELLLAAAGFSDIKLMQVSMVWQPKDAEMLLNGVYTGNRSKKLVEAQSPEIRKKVEQSMLDFAEQFKTPTGYQILRLAILLTARKR